jgi:hypothetical protein
MWKVRATVVERVRVTVVDLVRVTAMELFATADLSWWVVVLQLPPLLAVRLTPIPLPCLCVALSAEQSALRRLAAEWLAPEL